MLIARAKERRGLTSVPLFYLPKFSVLSNGGTFGRECEESRQVLRKGTLPLTHELKC